MMDAIEVNTLRLGQVTLTSAQFEKSGAFYSQILGLKPLSSAEKSRTFGAGAVPLVTLIDDLAAKSFPRRPGLYHMAIRVPDRFWLARALYQLAERNYPLQGAADHGVSEAIYLADPREMASKYTVTVRAVNGRTRKTAAWRCIPKN
jgi:catechol 2,3-dioxygenase